MEGRASPRSQCVKAKPLVEVKPGLLQPPCFNESSSIHCRLNVSQAIDKTAFRLMPERLPYRFGIFAFSAIQPSLSRSHADIHTTQGAGSDERA